MSQKNQFLNVRNNPTNQKLIELSKYYWNLPLALRSFVRKFYELHDYNKFTADFSKRIKKQFPDSLIDGRHMLYIEHISILLNTTMNWPDGKSCKVYELPEEEKQNVIDYAGYEIGMPRGQGNDCLINIYKKYITLFPKSGTKLN